MKWLGFISLVLVYILVLKTAQIDSRVKYMDSPERYSKIISDKGEFERLLREEVAREIYDNPEMVRAMMALYDKRLRYWTLMAVKYPNEYYRTSFLDTLNEIAMANYVNKCSKIEIKEAIAKLKDN